MAGSKRDFLFRFLGDSKSLENAARRAERSLGGVDEQAGAADAAVAGLRKGAVALGAAFGLREAWRGINTLTEAASGLGESVNAVQVTTGDAADAVFRLGETAAEALGLSKREVNEAAVAFSAFGERIEGGVEQAFGPYITRAADFASVMNIEVGEALEKFRSGLAGESEPLRAFGIDLSAASVGAFAVANGIAESASKMTEAEKIQARYGLLMEQTSKVQGDFANTSDSLANQQRILNAEWENAQAELGERLIPLMTQLTETASDAIPVVVDMADNFDRGRMAFRRFADNANDFLNLGLTENWTQAEEAMWQFAQVQQHINTLLSEGRRPAQVAGEALIAMSQNATLTTDAILKVQEATGLSDAEFIKTVDSVLALDKEVSNLGFNMFTLENATADMRDEADRAAVAMEEDLAEGAREAAYQLLQEADAADDTADAIGNLADETRKLVDPVFRAKKAQEAFNKALEDAQEDGEITADELDRLTEANLDLKAATEAVNADNITAYGESVAETADLVGASLDTVNEALADTDDPLLVRFDDIVSRLESVTGKRIQIDLSSVRLASEAQIQQAVERALFGLQRNGVLTNVYL